MCLSYLHRTLTARLTSCFFSIFEVEIATSLLFMNSASCNASERTFMRLDNRGGLEILPNVNASKKEEMRFYSKSGESFATKVHRINHCQHYVLTCALHTKATLDECNWCCKLFPFGMQKCPTCPQELFYCDKECQTKAWPVHRLKPAHSSS